jgi:four helix bundle protein
VDDVVKEQIDKTLRELRQAKRPVERSRISKTSNGYIFLIAWSNASLLRILNRKFTSTLPKSEYRLKAQSDDSCRSVVANIEEGFARQTTSEYINFLGYSRASLIEEKGDIQRSLQDGFLRSIPGSNLKDLGIDLTEWHEALKKSVISKTNNTNYRELEDFIGKVKVTDLTYEIFIELINKTDWNIRKLIESLEKKMNADQKFYKVEKMRIYEKFK